MRNRSFNNSLFESVLDDITAVEQGAAAKKLADKSAIKPEDMFNQSGNKRYRIGCPMCTTNTAYEGVKGKIVRLYENFLEIMMHQHFTKDFVVRVIFYYNKYKSYSSYCENIEDFSKTVDSIGCELSGDSLSKVHIDYICNFNPVQECSRNVFLRDWILFKQGMYSQQTAMSGMIKECAYAATSSMTNKIDIDMRETNVPPYLPIIDFYCWLFGEKGGKQKTEREFKKKYHRLCGPQMSILCILDWMDDHPEAFKDWQLEVVGYITPSGGSRERVFVLRLYDKTKTILPFSAYFDFIQVNVLGRMSSENIRSIFGEGAIPMYLDTLKIYVELPYKETFEKYAEGMKHADFTKTLYVTGKTEHAVLVQLLRLDDNEYPMPHVIGDNGEMLSCPFDRQQYEFLRVRFENVFRKDRE